jgi:hypothetical protein
MDNLTGEPILSVLTAHCQKYLGARQAGYPNCMNRGENGTKKSPGVIKTSGLFMIKFRRRPTLPHSLPCSTIGAKGLNFRVRDGNGCDPFAIATEKL